jgi:glucokinase
MIVLAADVGGTHTKVALAHSEAGALAVLRRDVFPTQAHESLERIVQLFLSQADVASHAGRVAGACFAVAGPVERGCARLTNVAWQIDESTLERHFSIPRVSVVNDFAAAGLGIEQLPESDFLTLQQGVPLHKADRAVVGAGTGLGVAWLTWIEGRYHVHPSEGGHADFAPIDAVQDELLIHLRRELGRVSYERVLSGAGLPRVFAFLKQRGPALPSEALLNAMTLADPAGAVTEFALSHRDAVAEQALDIFTSAYGAFAGNMALTALAHGGIYVAGGIAPKIAAKLADGTFMRAFTAKGRMRPVLESIPVKVVMNEQVGLIGALAEAARIAG